MFEDLWQNLGFGFRRRAPRVDPMIALRYE